MPVERRGIRALQIWCRRVTESYENVNIIDMTTSWRDGLAFCALIHHFRPTIIDYDSLKPENVYSNNELAYRVAEEGLGIPSLLDPQDMVDSSVPDKFSIVTYVSQFYHLLKEEDGSRSPSLAFRNSESETDSRVTSSNDNTPVGTPKTVPKRLFTSSSLILQNNKYSPLNSPISQSPEIKSNFTPEVMSQISCPEPRTDRDIVKDDPKTYYKSITGIAISAVCEEIERKAKLSEKDS